MRPFRFDRTTSLLLTILAAAVAGNCGSEGAGTDAIDDAGLPAEDASVPDAARRPDPRPDASVLEDAGADAPAPQILEISPNSVELDVIDGFVPTQAFAVTLDGVDVRDQITWMVSRPQLGTIDVASAAFTPIGEVGGVVTLTAHWADRTAAAQVTVRIEKNVDLADLTPAIKDAFNTPDGPDPSLDVVYPRNETVFPLEVHAPEVQWNGGEAADVYRIRVEERFYRYTVYVQTALPARHRLDALDWRALQESGTGPTSDPLQVSVARRSGETVYEAVQQTWHVARTRLRGSLFYSREAGVCGGQSVVKRSNLAAEAPEAVFEPNTCWGCHTVSRDGRRLAAVFNDGAGPLFTLDVTSAPATYAEISPAQPAGNFVFAAYNHDGSKLLVSDNNARLLRVLDAHTGAVLNNDALGERCGEPAWSPNGAFVAGVCNLTVGGWTFDSSNGDLVVGTMNADGVTVDTKVVLAEKGTGHRIAYPDFSSDNAWVAFGRTSSGSRTIGAGTLHMIDLAGEEPKDLVRATHGAHAFNPAFAPHRGGGYRWLVFTSRQNYGNRLVGADRNQLWVTAISDPPVADDPSFPAFRLEGQELCGSNGRTSFVRDVCKEDAEACRDGFDCCSGVCVPNAAEAGAFVCGEAVAGECSALGNRCEAPADCCDVGAVCTDGYCEVIVP